MSVAAVPRTRDARADTLRRAAFEAERIALGAEARAAGEPAYADLARIARRHADDAWNLLWLYLDGMIS